MFVHDCTDKYRRPVRLVFVMERNGTDCTLQYNKESAIPIPVYLDWHEHFSPHQSSSWHLNENVNFCTNYSSRYPVQSYQSQWLSWTELTFPPLTHPLSPLPWHNQRNPTLVPWAHSSISVSRLTSTEWPCWWWGCNWFL